MEFNTFTFAVYLIVCLTVYYALPTWPARKVFLLVASYGFYAAWNPPLIVLLWFMTFSSWAIARWIANTNKKQSSKRKALVLLMILIGLAVLFYFKYSQFLLNTVSDLAAIVGIDYTPPRVHIALPLGISFFTFETLSYTVDVYRRAAKPAKLFDYCVFVAFFPHLVAGPIIRAAELLPQIDRPERDNPTMIPGGLVLVLFGMFSKVVLADTFLSRVVNPAFQNLAGISMIDAWALGVCFTGQVFFDFAGYSLIALGTAQLFGFWLPRNFNFPFGAVGFTDFWARWHITLSTWIRDYIYFPLSISALKMFRRRLPRGIYNRVQFVASVYAVMFTMLLAGLWHGGSWTMAIMGMTFGGLLMIEHILRKLFPTTPKLGGLWAPIAALLTFLAITIPMTMFRSPDMAALTEVIGAMFGGSPTIELVRSSATIIGLVIVGCTFVVHFVFRNKGFIGILEGLPASAKVPLYALVFALLLVCDQPDIDFIYFAF